MKEKGKRNGVLLEIRNVWNVDHLLSLSKKSQNVLGDFFLFSTFKTSASSQNSQKNHEKNQFNFFSTEKALKEAFEIYLR